MKHALALVLSFIAATSVLAAEPSPEHLLYLIPFRDSFVPIKPGVGHFPRDFQMGRDDGPPSERPAHQVTLRPYEINKYEVSQHMWEFVMGQNPSRWKGYNNSVELVSWDDANEFCKRITRIMREGSLIGKQTIRLPTEAEWEYAARAGTTTRYSFGDDVALLDAHAWSTRNAAGNDPPGGALKPNAWNLHDVHGYLWEWCADTWHDDYRGAPADGSAWTAGGDQARRVLRGGSWKDPADQLTSSYRRAAERTTKDDAIGLRCVLQ